MMGPWKAWYNVALVVAWLLSLSIVHFATKHSDQLNAALETNFGQIVTNDSVTKSVTHEAETSRKEANRLDTQRGVVRTQIRVVHDSVFVKGESVTIVSPAIAQLILADDSVIASQKHSLALQDTLIASLRVGITLRDSRIKLLESEVTPGKFKRLITATKWIAIGAVIGVAYQRR